MPEQRIVGPYGDIFSAATPALDKLSNDLYAEQKQRQARQSQDNAALDNSMSKEFANVKAADVPLVIDSYGKYKEAKKKLLFDKDLQKDPKKYAQAQQEANELLANTYYTINGSREQKEKEKAWIAAHQAHPDSFDDNFGTLLSAAQKTPLSQLQSSQLGDLSNLDTYVYKGSNTDFQKIAKEAAGQPKAVYQAEAPVDATGLQTKITPYLYPNSPAQYLQSYMGALAQHKAGRDAALAWDSIPQEQKQYVDEAFDDLTPEQWQRRTGSTTPQKLIPANPENKAERFAIIQAKLHALSNEPKEGAPVFRTNEAKKFQMETDRQMKMQAIRQANAKDLVTFKKQIDPNDKELNNLWVDKVIQNLKEDAKSGPTVRLTQNGKVVHEKNIPLGPVLSSSLQKAGVSPLYMTMLPDGRFRVTYPLKDKEGNPVKISSGSNAGEYAIDETLSVPISEDELGISLGKKNVTGKQRDKEILNVINGGSKKSVPKPKDDPLGLF